MPNKILVFLEQRSGEIKKSSFETAKAAANIAKELNSEVEAIVLGSDIKNIEKTGNFGVEKVVSYKSAELDQYSSSAYSGIVADYAREISADILFFSNTAMGRDVAPLVSVKLNAGILTDCTALEVSSGEIIATRPVYAGKALVEAKIKAPIKVFTLRPNVFNPGQMEEKAAQVTTREAGNVDLKSKVVEIKKSEGKLDVAEAEIIVSGGRGLKGPENFNLIEDLAEALGGAVGASRAVVDAGWRPHNEQVGQTGKTVSPNLYVAVGISGAIQHLAGMSSSKYIVAINKDKDAPIFGIADYGIAGDVFEIIPALTEELRKHK